MGTPVTLVSATGADVGTATSPLPVTAAASSPIPITGAQYPVGAVALIHGSANAANAVAAATLTGGALTTVYLAGFEITGSGATAGLPVAVTVTGLLGGTRTYIYTFATGALVANTPLIVQFTPPLPASAVNTAIVVSCPAGGTGAANNCTVAHGYHV